MKTTSPILTRSKVAISVGLSFYLFVNLPSSLAAPIDLGTSFDGTPWISSRAAGLGECLSTTANGLDAFYYNPALIGGAIEKEKKPMITHLFFPYIGNSASDGGNKILTDHLTGEALSSDAMAKSLIQTDEKQRPYARVSATPVVLIDRFMTGYTYNQRIASHQNNEDPTNPLFHIDEKTMSGPFLGFSAVAPKDEFYMGVSAAYMRSTHTSADWDETTGATSQSRKAALDAGKMSYEGLPIHVGMLYRFSKTYKPTLSFVMNDIGSTRYSPSDKTQTTLIEHERATLGASVSPPIKDWGVLNVSAEATDLTNSAVKTKDKFRISSEFTMGERKGADAGLSFRLGYTAAGASFGVGLNLGLLTAQIASFAEDIGAGSVRVVERRSVVNIGINIADY